MPNISVFHQELRKLSEDGKKRLLAVFSFNRYLLISLSYVSILSKPFLNIVTVFLSPSLSFLSP